MHFIFCLGFNPNSRLNRSGKCSLESKKNASRARSRPDLGRVVLDRPRWYAQNIEKIGVLWNLCYRKRPARRWLLDGDAGDRRDDGGAHRGQPWATEATWRRAQRRAAAPHEDMDARMPSWPSARTTASAAPERATRWIRPRWSSGKLHRKRTGG
jgi:hypothetical protein